MSTKPTIALARFADTGGADKTAPSGGLRDSGFVAGTPADQSIVNELVFQLYSWALYLNDGVLSGAHSIDSTLAVAGALTVSGAEVVAGALTVGGQSITFTDFTFTATNGSDQLVATAHGRETGDGPIRVGNSGGALPAGLVSATDYYVIKVDANTWKACTSRVNALSGTAITMASNGTGTQTALHQAGTTRVTDAAVTRNLTVGGGVSVATLAAASDDRPVYVDSSGNLKRGHGAIQFSYTFLGSMLKASNVSDGAQIDKGSTAGSVKVSAEGVTSGSTLIFRGVDGLPKGFNITKVVVRVTNAAGLNRIYNLVTENPSVTRTDTDVGSSGTHTRTITPVSPIAIGDNTTVEINTTSRLNDELIGFDVFGTMN